ncbi:hypothetical protein, variant 2 [Aphanomyces astaci]|nr:hypothetical protein, variant 2 [Aphanomyces astaci]ETV66511.1 hypothetical protein, variant 2 [Aphanomyces astaci]|eukprot:XP_009844038.1 hypothetical protein, variant 2 [Aphanomyces astaci]
MAAIQGLACVYHAALLPPFMKLSPLARSFAASSSSMLMASPAVSIAFLDDVALNATLVSRLNAGLERVTGVVDVLSLPHDEQVNVLTLRPFENFRTWVHTLLWLCENPMVLYVTQHRRLFETQLPPSPPSHHRRNLDADTANIMGTLGAQSRGILGNDVVVAVTDSGLYLDHDQIDQPSPREFDIVNLNARKVVLYHVIGDKVDQSETVTCGHGTHVTGILAGSSWSQTSPNVGLAPNAKVAFTDIGTQDPRCANIPNIKCRVDLATPWNLRDYMGPQLSAGARIFSYSWGLPGDDYTRQARDFDQLVYNNPEILLVIAAGNSGDNGTHTIASPAGAKNALTVGASLSSVESLASSLGCPAVFNPQSVASFSSQGPTTDGRIKPDVVAPGLLVVSARSEASNSMEKTSRLCPLQGTSQATPLVAGMAVLLTEWLRDGWWKDGEKNVAVGMKSIPAALLKALVIHSARGLTRRLNNIKGVVTCKMAESQAQPLTQYPDNMQGYGLPDMSSVATFGQNANLTFLPNTSASDSPAVAHKGEHVYSFIMRPNETLRATLVWNDPPGTLFATKLLQNDLDLSITVPNSTVIFHPMSGQGGGKDALNNVEMVSVAYDTVWPLVPAAADGDLLRVDVHVAGFAVLLGRSQPYALVASSGLIGPRAGDNAADSPSPAPLLTTSGVVWQPWMTILVAALGGALVLVGIVVWVLARRRRGRSTYQVYVGSPPTPQRRQCRPGSVNFPSPEQNMCPYCDFLTPDPVVLVDHVQRVHHS